MWGRRRQPVDEKKRAVKDREHSRERTMNRAVKLLAAKPRSIQELRERLLEKTWTDQAIVDAVIEKLKEYKYLDDEQYAHELAVSELRRRPQGRRRLASALSRKKLDRQTLDIAIKNAYEHLPESSMIENAIERRINIKGRPVTRKDIKDLFDHLVRRGFSYDLIREKLDRLSLLGGDENGN